MTGWPQLPLELRVMIFGFVRKNYYSQRDLVARTQPASVCREWQYIFEPWTFRRITLDQDRLADFDNIVSNNERRRGYVFQIFLCIRLEEYDCTSCEEEEDEATIDKNNAVFINALRKLTDSLSSWKRTTDSGPSLLLELGAFSPSDCKHTFRDFRLTEQYPYHCQYPPQAYLQERSGRFSEIAPQFREEMYQSYKTYLASMSRMTTRSRFCPGWARAQQGEPSLGARRRLLGTIGHPMSGKAWKFATVEAVDSLRIRRHFYRNVSPSILGMLLQQSFTRIRRFTHEKWFAADDASQIAFDKEYTVLLSKCLPTTLEKLRVFQEFETVTHPVRPSVSQDEALARALAEGSRNVQLLCASFLVDAAAFFPSIISTADWNFPYFPHLVRVSLTAQCLSPDTNPGSICSLLSSICRALYHMPLLEAMQIWNAGRNYASYFTFWRPGPIMRQQKSVCLWYGERPSVKFKSTWGLNNLNLGPAVAYWAEHGLGLFLPEQPPTRRRNTRQLLQTYRIDLCDRGKLDSDNWDHLWPRLFLNYEMVSRHSVEQMKIEHVVGAV